GAEEATRLVDALEPPYRGALRLLAAESYLLARQPGFAEAALEMAREEGLTAADAERPRLLDTLARSEQGRFREARSAAAALAAEGGALAAAAEAARVVAARYEQGVPQKSVVTAMLLSILPGAGQLYVGAYQEAALAFALNVVLGV